MARVAVAEFGIIQKSLAGAHVTFYVADESGNNTGTKVVLYAAGTGSTTRANPQVLDENGMLEADCYVDSMVMANLSNITSLTERSVRKISVNPIEYPLPVTSSGVMINTTANALLNDPNFIAVSGVAAEIATVAGISADVVTVAGIDGDVTTVAGISANVTAVGGSIANVNAVAGGLTNINAVAAGYPVSILATGSTTGRTPEARFAEVFNVKDYGAVGNGTTDDRAAIQAAEDAANALGIPAIVYFPQGVYAISATITKKSNVYWEGKALIKRRNNDTATGLPFSLVLADTRSNFGFDGLSFENVTHDRYLSSMTAGTPAKGTWNVCIDTEACSNFYIRHCNFTKFSSAIAIRANTQFSIHNNTIIGGNAKTYQSILDGTFTDYASYGATGGINSYWNTLNLIPNSWFSITENYIEVPGLDTAIDGLTQVYNKQPCIIANNRIRGANAGIQIYRGSYTDPGTAPTYQGALIVANNHITATVEQGIYIRAVLGVIVANNHVERCSALGSNGDNSAGSIIVRVNPFTAAGFLVSTNCSNDHAILIHGNRIVDHGLINGTNDAAIQIENDNVIVRNNEITKTDELWNATAGQAIVIGNGKKLRNFTIDGNIIQGRWNDGIIVSDILKSANIRTDWFKISNNNLLGTYNFGINIANWYSFNGEIIGNNIRSCVTEGVTLRNVSYVKVEGNTIVGSGASTIAVYIRGGTLASDTPSKLSAGSVTANQRRGGTVIVDRNQIYTCPTPFNVTEINGVDSNFFGRCLSIQDNFIDGEKFIQAFAGGTPNTTFNARTWIKGEIIPNSTVAAGQPAGKICLTSGQYGSVTFSTGDATSGSPIITNVSSLDGYGPGIFITATGFTGTVKVIAVDTSASTITVNANATSSNVGSTLTVPTPTFGTLANVT